MTPEQIKRLRQRLGFTQMHLAQELGVSLPTVNRWEMGRSKASPLSVLSMKRLERDAKNFIEASKVIS